VSAHNPQLGVELLKSPAVGKPFQWWLKGVFDRTGALLGMIALGIPFLAIALGIKLNSPGPVFFRQLRIKEGAEEFTLLKFRTMVNGAEEMQDAISHLNHANGPLFKARDDPRLTRIGIWLRRTYLDELPQLVNVLRGEMSMVGPRPCVPRELASHPRELAFRFTVPQGMTGPWQINGHHGITFEEQLRVEREYIEGWSLARDLRILVKTVPLVARRTGL
jgi:lipopolysaccharide/colanic/teichoic acid biosynthesis glycosyltransferase